MPAEPLTPVSPRTPRVFRREGVGTPDDVDFVCIECDAGRSLLRGFGKEPLHSATASMNRFVDKVTANRGRRKRMRVTFSRKMSHAPVLSKKIDCACWHFCQLGSFHIGTS